MSYDPINEFTDWCYDNYVNSRRNYRLQEAYIYHEMLVKHYRCNLNGEQLLDQRIRAQVLLHEIDAAIENNELENLKYANQTVRENIV